MAKIKNRHGPGCMLCAHEKTKEIKAGFRGYNKHRYCDNQKPCDGMKIKPPEYQKREICAAYRGKDRRNGTQGVRVR
jgi:hypothetical protein